MKHFLFILFFISIFFSCTDELMPGTGEEQAVTYTRGTLTVNIENPADVATRSTEWYDSYFASSDIYEDENKHERWRHNLTLVFFDSDLLLEHINVPGPPVDLTNDSGKASDVYGTGQTEYMAFTLGLQGINITTGAHYFYILCNLPSEFMYALRDYCNERIGTLTKDDFEKLVLNPATLGLEGEYGEYMAEDIAGRETIALTPELDYINKPLCFMSNVTSPAPYYLAPYTVMPDGGSYPAVNGFMMTIGKAFAKVSVAYIQDEADKRLTDVQWRIVNDPKHTYMLPNIFKGQVHTPHYDKEVENGNFNAYFENYFNPNSHIEKTFPDSTNFSWRDATIAENGKKNHAYCLENGNLTPLQGNSTMVLVKARYLPAQWLNPDDSPGNENPEGTFWRIKNKNGTYLSGYYNAAPRVGSSQETVKYEGGITYYPIWLETDGRYMVERNHFYKIAITDVLSAGAPDLDNVMDPMEPLAYLSTDTRSADIKKNLPEVATCIRWKQKN
ncbi:MAG: hypothetical protein LUG98_05325 [Tannerellaceae bacterium]|nr:hypothetical protein [Tannerellaceae bacterium]